MLPAKHITSTGAKSPVPRAAPSRPSTPVRVARQPAPRNFFESICRKCPNRLDLSPSPTVCNYHGDRNRIQIEYICKCPKGDF